MISPSQKPQSIQALFELQAEKAPGQLAILFEASAFSYQEINHRANQFAHYLLKKGLKPDKLVGLCLERSVDLIIAMLGILKAGGAYVPLDPQHPQERLRFILEDTRADWLVTTSAGQAKFSEYRGDLIVLDQAQEIIDAYSTDNPQIPLAPDNLAYVIYTSGSTGTPKGVLIEHHSLLDYCRWFADYSHCAYPARIDFSSNPIFDLAVTTSIVPLALGLSQVICPEDIKQDAYEYLHYLEKQRINIIKITPGYFKVLLQAAQDHPTELGHLEIVILGGENLLGIDCAKWLELFPRHLLINEYGPTEATVAVSHYKINADNVKRLPTYAPIGKAGNTMICQVLDTELKPVAPGASGELHIGGTCLARGYLNRPELMEKQFIKDPLSPGRRARLYKTGDLASSMPSGDLQLLGRIDDQVKIRGFRIEPAEIEACLKSHPDIQDAVIMPLSHGLHQEKRLIAYYIPREAGLKINPGPINTAQLRHHLKQRLVDYMLPSAFVRLASLPLNSNGKLDKKALPLPQFQSGSEHYLPPKTRLEKQITAIWEEELHLEKISVQDNFFELGGNSLSAARIILKMKKHITPEVQLDCLYRSPTIRQLAGGIKTRKRAPHAKTSSKQAKPKDEQTRPLGEFQFMCWLAGIAEPKTKKLNIVDRKRVAGKLDIAILNRAFHSLFEKHEIMLYRPSTLVPGQFRDRRFDFKVMEKNVQSLGLEESELFLKDSLNQLLHHPWKKQSPLMIAKAFYLEDGSTELQVCLSHMIFDEVSREILFSDLSDFYHWHINELSAPLDSPAQFHDYIQQERKQINSALDQDLCFWESYLKDTDLFVFPEAVVVKDMEARGWPYSSYFELPESWCLNLHHQSLEHKLSLAELLCGALGMALADFNAHQKKVLVNFVKSAREDDSFDRTIGCFLRLDSIKLDLSGKQDIINLSKQAQQSVLDTAAHQTCPGGLIMACLNYKKTTTRMLFNNFFGLIFQLYAKLFSQLRLNPKVLARYPYLIVRRQKPGFVININIWSGFIGEEPQQDYFGLQQKCLPLHQYDLCNIDNVLEVSFLKDHPQDKNYLVISGNLQPDFREIIGEKIIETLL